MESQARIGKYEFDKLEPEVLEYWKNNSIHQKVNEKNKGKTNFYFLDGPPYTSGRVHIGTAWNKSLKDMVLRYKRAKGFDVWDRAGYDMHGLPTEHKVQEKLSLKYKDDIKKFGIERFVRECRKLSEENLRIMNEDFRKLGVWMDFDNAYKSVNNSFIEGEWWLVKKAHENQRLYEGEKPMSWCADCATALAKHELEYETIEDDSIFLKFKIIGTENEYLIIWTTTPWTIPFNLGVMVNPEFEYVKAKVGNDIWIIAKGLVAAFVGGVLEKKYEVIETMTGEQLAGIKYIHPLYGELKEVYDELSKDHPKVHTVILSSEYVDLGAGTGLVHTAPGCGPEDYEIGHKENIPPFNNLSESGVFPESMGKYSGWVAKRDDKKFIEDLNKKGALIATTKVEHEYAHCWRCKNPIIYKTTTQWFFRVEDLKENMRELNRNIKWVPDWAGSRQFDSWLNNLRDNGITRQRYWGTPMPLWRCGKCSNYVVIGSAKELEDLGGDVPEDLHLPWIDKVTLECKKCGGTMKRLPDILDVWVDAGTTSWTCLDYPQKTEQFDLLWPPDFILEGKDQIRGWFNLLFVASMVSMNKPSFKSVYMHGFVQDSEGRKMSKSLGNYILPEEVIGKYGADTLRYYTISGTQPGLDLNYNFEDMKTKHRNLDVLWNLHKFLIELSSQLGKSPEKIDEKSIVTETEEKYMLSKLNSAIKTATQKLDNSLLNEAPEIVEGLFLELSRTYLQIVREKSSVGKTAEKETVIYVLYKVMMDVLKMFTPVAPFISEKMYLNLKDAFGLKEESISMYPWPKYDESMVNIELEDDMETAKSVIQSILSAREKIGMGVRWPLREAVIASEKESVRKAIEHLTPTIKSQTNVKEIRVKEKVKIDIVVKAEYKRLGPDFGELAPKIIARMSLDSAETIISKIKKNGKYEIEIDGEKVAILEEHIIVEKKAPKGYELADFRHGEVLLNKEITPDLEAEGFAREIMRRVQSLRKKAGMEKKDRINLYLMVDAKMKEMLYEWEEVIADKVGANEIGIHEREPGQEYGQKDAFDIKGKKISVYFNNI